jgi:hypothetical protein
MGLRVWSSVTGTVVQSTAGRYSSGYEWMVANDDADRVAYNRSLVYVRHWIRIDQATWSTSWGGYNLTAQNSTTTVNGTVNNVTTKYDLRKPRGVKYLVGTHTDVFPSGLVTSNYVYHDGAGNAYINISSFFKGTASTNFTSATTSANHWLPQITRQHAAPSSITFETPTYGVGQTVSWVAAASGGTYKLEYSINGGAWTQEATVANPTLSYSVPAARFTFVGTIQYRVSVMAQDGWSTSNFTTSLVRTIAPPIYIGTTAVPKLYIGNTLVAGLYLGTTKIQ